MSLARTVIRLSAIGGLVATVACATGPAYQRPVAAGTANFKEMPAADSRLGAAWKTATPQDDRIRPKWWELFGDSTLNGLEEQVGKANPTVAQAEATFQ